MTWPDAKKLAKRGARVRRRVWPVGWTLYYVAGRGNLRAVAIIERSGVTTTTQAEDFGREEFAADDWNVTVPVPLATRTLSTIFDATLTSFGSHPAGLYRMVYEQGALYYVATGTVGAKNQLRVNAYSTSTNGWRITRYPGLVDLSLDHHAPGDGFQYSATDPRSEAELLADIAARNRGAETVFEHPGGEVFMYLGDDYVNNAYAAQSPQFSLYAV